LAFIHHIAKIEGTGPEFKSRLLMEETFIQEAIAELMREI
jgi:hypothetical protein